jgi:hypothetical protein
MEREWARVCCGLGEDAMVGLVQLGKDQVSTGSPFLPGRRRLTFSVWKRKTNIGAGSRKRTSLKMCSASCNFSGKVANKFAERQERTSENFRESKMRKTE